MPRQVSITINHTFVNLGKTGHNMAESLGITTVWTTMLVARIKQKSNVWEKSLVVMNYQRMAYEQH